MQQAPHPPPPLAEALARVLALAGASRAQILDFEALQRLEGVPGTTVYVTGSLVEEGLGNAGSDVDVVVVCDAEAGFDLARNFTATGHFVGRRRIEYAYWKPDKVDEVARRLGPPASIPSGFNLLDEEEINFIHRIKVGLPLLNVDEFQALRARFDFDRFREYLTEDSICRINSTLEDVWGMLDERALETGILRARDLLGWLFVAYCAYLDQTNPNGKWRLQMFAKLGGHPRTAAVVDAFWRLGFPDVRALRADPAAAEAYLRECIDFVNDTVEWIQR